MGLHLSVPVLSSLFSVQGKLRKNISCPSIVTNREYIRHREASSSFRAAQILRQGCLNPILRNRPVLQVTDQCCRRCGLYHLESFFFCDGLRGGQKDDAEVFSETCESSSVSLLSGHSSCHKVRSSRPCVGRFPLGLDDLTLWHDEWPDDRETLLLSHVSLSKSWKDGQE